MQPALFVLHAKRFRFICKLFIQISPLKLTRDSSIGVETGNSRFLNIFQNQLIISHLSVIGTELPNFHFASTAFLHCLHGILTLLPRHSYPASDAFKGRKTAFFRLSGASFSTVSLHRMPLKIPPFFQIAEMHCQFISPPY
jgi:hypothetical protein